jgi:ParB family transcriptional regulator, chromosome partitioning protein
MSNPKGGLGRGLSALIPQKKTTITETPAPGAFAVPANPPGTVIEQVPKGDRILHVRVGDILPNPYQPRREFHPEELQDLTASIAEFGIIQPLTVTEKGNGMFELIAGERRLRAAKAAGLERVPVIVRAADEQRKLELALIENLQRADLNPIEEALSYDKLMTEFGLTQESVALRVGKSRPVVANALRLLRLPSDMQQAVGDSRLSMSMARVLCGMEEPQEQRAMFERMLKGEYNVRQAEEASRAQKPASRVRAETKDVTILGMEEELRGALGTRVVIKKRVGKGRIEIEFFSDAELDHLVNRLRK